MDVNSLIIGLLLGFVLGLAVPVILSIIRSYRYDRHKKKRMLDSIELKPGKAISRETPELMSLDEE